VEKIKNLVTILLVTFALISIGFVLGKNSVKGVEINDFTSSGIKGNFVAVYYLHSTFRCVTCNTIEKLTYELLNDSYDDKLSNGKIQWREIDFQENETIAKKFDVVASCVVVGRIVNGEFVEYQRLDNVWELVNKPIEFKNYIARTIDENLALMEEIE